jgi:lipopolysaccharide/colanic/teichoic acid biosynthesis glycosyltransferase
MTRLDGKRCLDAVVAAAALILLSPALLIIAAFALVCIGRPLIFSQWRPGLHGRLFKLYKFRTMTEARGADGELLPDSARLGRFGRVLRSSSLDELPELWNVLKGEMSLVGPRPLLPEYLPLYTGEQSRRHEVRPGITGWAQVNGRNELGWEDRFRLDVWYVENRSLLLDLRIIRLTIANLFSRRGISHPDEATMPKFKGSVR